MASVANNERHARSSDVALNGSGHYVIQIQSGARGEDEIVSSPVDEPHPGKASDCVERVASARLCASTITDQLLDRPWPLIVLV
ncbi:MAG TPA: hypothetical protein VGP18_06915 [Solirubrobacteraceae bacterium]|jgi:hypothetical protein|nr:hypothetical protein [Solirubrobacteraceae bacterium]